MVNNAVQFPIRAGGGRGTCVAWIVLTLRRRFPLIPFFCRSWDRRAYVRDGDVQVHELPDG
jgi:hypothetical protein